MEIESDIVRQARRTDLTQWLRTKNEPLKQAGRWWYLESHDSLRIQGNKWYHNSQCKGGNAIDFLVHYYKMTPRQAIIELTRFAPEYGLMEERNGVKEKNKEVPVFNLASLKTDNDCRRVIAYLVKNRSIPYDVVRNEITEKRLYQEKGTANAVFAICDETGSIVGAELNGTLSYKNTRYKGIIKGSLGGYGYNTGQRYNPRYILFFESAVDLLSFISISRKRSKLINECLLVSMAGLKLSVVEIMLQMFGNSETLPVFCVDNDTAADAFITRWHKISPNFLTKKPDKMYKDWNDQLQNIICNYVE